jgi:hypothetical protein
MMMMTGEVHLMKKFFVYAAAPVLVIALFLTACAPAVNSTPTAAVPTVGPTGTTVPTAIPSTPTAVPSAVPATVQPASFTDPFAYCAAVGTIDVPDAKYTGVKMPEGLAKSLQKASGAAADAPLDLFVNGSSWRCMNGKVYACFVGANLPCDSKANIDKTPTAGENDFCKANPNSDFIPAVVTGHDTVYDWHCKNGTAETVKQVFQVDQRGYIADIWYLITP